MTMRNIFLVVFVAVVGVMAFPLSLTRYLIVIGCAGGLALIAIWSDSPK